MTSPALFQSFSPDRPLAFIGGGNMASAILGGLIQRGLSQGAVRVIEPFEAARRDVGDEGAPLGDHDGAARSARLGEIEGARDLRERRGLHAGAVGELGRAGALDAAVAGKIEELGERTVCDRRAARRRRGEHAGRPHGGVESSKKMARVAGHGVARKMWTGETETIAIVGGD
jgi:hypothetical protein